MDNFVLSIDCGTSGMRGIIFDPSGEKVCEESENYTQYYALEPGWCEAPGMMFWEILCRLTKALKEKFSDAFSKIIGMTVTCQRDTGTITDKAGNPLRDFIIWQDRRLLERPIPSPQPWRTLFKLVGKQKFVESFNVGTHAHWIKVHEPELWEKAEYYAFLSAHLFGKLTGKVMDSKSNMAGHVPFNFKKKEWCKDNEIIANIIRIEKEKLPPLVDSCEVIGKVTETASTETGLPVGLPVVSSGTDKGCETIGAGCISPRQASISLGTQATIETTTKKYYELISFFPPFPSVVPDSFNPEITIYCGFWMMEWYIKTFGQYDKYYCEQNGLNLFERLEEQILSVPAGSQGLVLHPYWGTELFKPEARGSVIGFSEKHTKETILRAIVEGIGYGLKEGMEFIEKKSGVKFEEVALSGGGSQNDTVCQIIADILGKEAYKVQCSSTSSLGAAMSVYKALGYYQTFDEVNEKMVHKTKVFKPDPDNSALYENIYRNIYMKAYKRFKPLYQQMMKNDLRNI